MRRRLLTQASEEASCSTSNAVYTGLQEKQAHATGVTKTEQTRLTCSCSAACTTSA